MSLTQLLIQVAARGTLLLLLTALAGMLFRRSSAATRHLIWTGGLTVSLIVPLISVSEPALPLLPATPATPSPVSRPVASPVVSTPSPVSPRTELWSGTMAEPAPVAPASPTIWDRISDLDWPRLLGLTWLLGLLLAALRLVAGWIAIARLARRAVPVMSAEWLATIRTVLPRATPNRAIRFLESSEVSTPCTWGTLAPTVLLPAVGAEWNAEERRQVVVHELAHVRRFDCATQIVTTLSVGLNWFNPLAWLAQRQCRVAREQACDDAVLAAGGMASTYAGLLLAAAAPEGGPWLPSEAQAMARRSQIGDRLLGVLDPARRRNPVDRRAIGWLSASALAAAIPVVSLGSRPLAVPPQSVAAAPALSSPASVPAPALSSPASALSPPASVPAFSSPASAPASAPSTPASAPSVSSASSASQVCDQTGQRSKGSSSSSYIDSDGDERRNWFTLTWTGPRCSVRIQGKGKVTFTSAEDDVATLSEGGRFEIETEENSVTRSYLVTNKGGSLQRRYQVDDKDATLDGDALKWRAELVLEFIRRTGYEAKARAARIRRRGGIDALVAEIGALRSDGVRSTYLMVGLKDSSTSAGDAARLLELTQGIDSDGDRAAVLKATPVALLGAEGVQRAYADGARGISSDGDLAAVLTSAIRSGKLTPGSCEWVLGLVGNIDSDGDRSAVLISATETLQWNSSCVRKSLEVTREISSDGDKAATLIRFLQRHGLPGDLVPVFFETTATIDSDGDHSSVLHRVINLGSTSDAVVEGLLVDSRAISSDGDHSSVLVAAARRGLVKSEKLKALYRDSAKEINSDGDREAAIRALERS